MFFGADPLTPSPTTRRNAPLRAACRRAAATHGEQTGELGTARTAGPGGWEGGRRTRPRPAGAVPYLEVGDAVVHWPRKIGQAAALQVVPHLLPDVPLGSTWRRAELRRRADASRGSAATAAGPGRARHTPPPPPVSLPQTVALPPPRDVAGSASCSAPARLTRAQPHTPLHSGATGAGNRNRFRLRPAPPLPTASYGGAEGSKSLEGEVEEARGERPGVAAAGQRGAGESLPRRGEPLRDGEARAAAPSGGAKAT